MRAYTQLDDAEKLSLMYIGDTQDPTWPANDFDSYMTYLLTQLDNPKPGWVRGRVYWAMQNGEIVGRIGVRLELNDLLRKVNGHIGYITMPFARGRGVAKEMLRQVLEMQEVRSIMPVLLTCDADNVASEKVILYNGGVFESYIDDGDVCKKRFWIHST